VPGVDVVLPVSCPACGERLIAPARVLTVSKTHNFLDVHLEPVAVPHVCKGS